MSTAKMFTINATAGTLVIQVPFRRGAPIEPPPVFASAGDLTVRLATGRRELMRSQMLRYEVFHREYQNKKFPLGIDRDPYDSIASHLIVATNIKKIVGTYRMIVGEDHDSFYANSEFDLSPLQALPGAKMELSRACIHRDFRSGKVLNLLWRGIAAFAVQKSSRWLIGIPSVKTSDPIAAARLYRAFQRQGWVHEDIEVSPRPDFRMRGFAEAMEASRDRDDDNLPVAIPPLMLSYFRAGAKVIGAPAYDAAFQCIDFPVALDLTAIDPRFRRKYIDAC